MATKAMWEVDPETRSKVRRGQLLDRAMMPRTILPHGTRLFSPLTCVLCHLVGRAPEGIE